MLLRMCRIVLTHPALEDSSFKKSLRDEAEAIFAARKEKPDFVEYEFKDYKGEHLPLIRFKFLLKA